MADQNSSDPLSPSLLNIPLQDVPPAPPTPPSQTAAASLSSSIENDMPISEVVATLKNTPQPVAPILTEMKTETQSPVPTPPPAVTITPTPPVTNVEATPMKPEPPPPAPVNTTTPAPTPIPTAVAKSPLYEDPDQIKLPGTV